MKRILITILLPVIALLNLSAQEGNNILGTYAINAECHITEMSGMEDYVETHTYDITIENNNEEDSDIKFFMPEHGIESYLKCKTAKDDKLDILDQTIDRGHDYSIYVGGSGEIVGDSIFMHYVTSSSIVEGVLDCNCKGIRKTNSALQPLPSQYECTIYNDLQNIVVETESDERQNVRIYDVSGRLVYSVDFVRNLTIDRSGFDKGVYIVHLTEPNGNSQNVKIVI